ncbi:MAG TPA: hypothetical protein VHO69_18680 [Phototrophicaceae bacterium]|nr:hypothetical protein [Phototrophicaceae bacterium]
METDNETLTTPQRWAEFLVVAAMLLLFGFFSYHQLANTGFFTEKFGALETVCLYGPILAALIAPVVRAVTGRRNPARPFEAARTAFLAAGSLWLLIVFPFNFAHLADTLPVSLRFALAWVTDDIGKIPLLIQVILGPVAGIPILWKYFSQRRQTIRQQQQYT